MTAALTAAQRSRGSAAEATLTVLLRDLTPDQACEILALTVTAAFSPAEAERIGNAINRRAWEQARRQPKDYPV